MSNLWFNIRFGIHFIQIGPDSFFIWEKSMYHEWARENEPDWKWFEVYTLFGVYL